MMRFREVTKRLSCFAIAAFFVFAANGSVLGQTSTQDFGTATGTNNSTTGSTTFIPNPIPVGTTYARVGTGGTPTVNLATDSSPLGSTGAFVKASASSTNSVTKVSPIVVYTGSREFYTSFKALFGDASAGNTATSGSWSFFQGTGVDYSNNTAVGNGQTFAGLQFTYSALAVSLAYRNAAGTFVTTGLTTNAFLQGQVYNVEIVGNNKASGAINYFYNGVSQSVAVQKFDLYINGIQIGNDLAAGGISNTSAIDSTSFTGIGSVANAANIFVDDVVVYNNVPSVIGSAPPSFTVNDVTKKETNSGTTNFIFTVTRSGDLSNTSTVNYETEDGTATVADNDYLPTAGLSTLR